MADIFNYRRRLGDKISDYGSRVLLGVWQGLVVVAWLAGVVVMAGVAFRIAEICLKPIFCFGYNVIPGIGSICQECVKCIGGACGI